MSSKQTISMDFGVLFNSRCVSFAMISHPHCSFSRVKPNWLCHFLIEAGVEAGVEGGGWEGGRWGGSAGVCSLPEPLD